MLQQIPEATWWKEAVVYQIYPRSFNDSTGDGIGDLKGITEKLDYLQNLGIDVIWLSPFYKSPNADNGYDISDYQNIMDEFGSMQDFDNMLTAIHKRGMKLMIDLVVNHTSDEHKWFKEAKKDKTNNCRNYYIWKQNKQQTAPNDWESFFSGSAWQLDAQTNEYYLHLFAKQQPDLNWDHQPLRKEIYDMMQFWLQKGINGFRMDVIAFISKDHAFPNYPEGQYGNLMLYANGPKVHEYLQEMNKEVLSKYDIMTVGEAFGVSAEEANLYVGKNRGELQMIFHFDHAVNRAENCFFTPDNEFTNPQIKAIFDKWDNALANDGWNSIYWGNHDNPRIISRLGNAEKYHFESATALASILLTLRGTPYIYQGDEIGMTNCHFTDIDEYNDIQVKNVYANLVKIESEKTKFLAGANLIARDHARTPMQWNDTLNAGFSQGPTTWLKVNENFTQINAKKDQQSATSVFKFYQRLIAIRKTEKAFVYGDYINLQPEHSQLWHYTRTLGTTEITVLVNLSNDICAINLKQDKIVLLISNYPTNDPVLLQPFEVRIFKKNIS